MSLQALERLLFFWRHIRIQLSEQLQLLRIADFVRNLFAYTSKRSSEGFRTPLRLARLSNLCGLGLGLEILFGFGDRSNRGNVQAIEDIIVKRNSLIRISGFVDSDSDILDRLLHSKGEYLLPVPLKRSPSPLKEILKMLTLPDKVVVVSTEHPIK